MNVVFDEQAPVIRNYTVEQRGLIGFLIKNGIAKTASQAQTILAVAAAIMFVLAVFLFIRMHSETGVDTGKNFVPAVRLR